MGLSILSCRALYKLCAIRVHDVRMCVVDSLLEWHVSACIIDLLTDLAFLVSSCIYQLLMNVAIYRKHNVLSFFVD